MPKFSNSEKKRIYETMLKTGKELFNEKGFYDITAEIIALKIGIAKGTFYHFFKNKEHLYMVINNNIQDEIFSNIHYMLDDLNTDIPQEQFYQILCYLVDEFIKNPLIMEIDPMVWKRIEEKAPRECVEKNDMRDFRLLQTLVDAGIRFRYDLEQTMRILQLQFLQFSYIRERTQNIEDMKIILKALSSHLVL